MWQNPLIWIFCGKHWGGFYNSRDVVTEGQCITVPLIFSTYYEKIMKIYLTILIKIVIILTDIQQGGLKICFHNHSNYFTGGTRNE